MTSIRALSSMLVLALVFACAGHNGMADRDAAAKLANRLASGDRSAADKARDAGRKPAEVIAFLGIQPGMQVLDLIAAGGWYTEVLSVAVGPMGRVYAQNNDFVLKLRDGANDKELTARLAGGRLANVTRLDREIDAMGLGRGSIDAAITALNFHDIANSRGPEAVQGFLAAVRTALEPGGIFGVIDHAGNPRNDNEKLHRIPEADVLKAVKAAGFEVAGKGQMLRNPADDRSRNVFEPDLRGKTDRFVLRLRKPL